LPYLQACFCLPCLSTHRKSIFSRSQKRLTKFTFTQLSGGVVLLHAKLDNFPDTLNFVFDTGSSGISLDSSTVDYFNLQPQPTERTIRGIAGIKKVSFLYNRKLHLEGAIC
jgi:hypothetical protein